MTSVGTGEREDWRAAFAGLVIWGVALGAALTPLGAPRLEGAAAPVLLLAPALLAIAYLHLNPWLWLFTAPFYLIAGFALADVTPQGIGPVAVALLIQVLAAMALFLLIRPLARPPAGPSRMRQGYCVIAAAALISLLAGLASVLAPQALGMSSVLSLPRLLELATAQASALFLGMLIILPPFLGAPHLVWRPFIATIDRGLDALLALLLLLNTGLLAFGLWQKPDMALAGLLPAPLLLPLPGLIWAAIRFGPAGGAYGVLVLTLIGTFTTSLGFSPFGATEGQALTFALQAYGGLLAISLLMVSIVAETRARRAGRLTRAKSRLAARAVQLRGERNAARHLVASVSHELRTALTPVLGAQQMLARRPLAAEDAARVALIGRGGRDLQVMVEDLLDETRLRGGRFRLSPGPVELSVLLADLRSAFGDSLIDRGQRLTIDRAPGVPERFLADGTRLMQILSNLLQNAVRHGDAGPLRLSLETGPADSQGRRRLVIGMEDSGPGIDAARLARLFEPGTGSGPGLGIGLSLVRGLAEAMNGHASATSVVGIGTRVEVSVEIVTSGDLSEDEAIPSSSATRRPRLLIVDAQPSPRALMRDLLSTRPTEVETASDGEGALDQLRRTAFDAVLLDLDMPGLDGLDLIRRIRDMPGPIARLPILVLSTYATDKTGADVMAAGADAVLEKPVAGDALLAALGEHVSAFNPDA